MDKNKDGFLSKDEVQGNSDLSARFDQLDANHDGKLSQAEMGIRGRNADRMSRSDRSEASDAAPTLPRGPQTPGAPPGAGDLEAGSTTAQ
jgi:hypothetical protein